VNVRTLGLRVHSEEVAQLVSTTAELCGWSDQPDLESADAIVIEYLPTESEDFGFSWGHLARKKPLCIFVGGSYAADRMVTDLLEVSGDPPNLCVLSRSERDRESHARRSYHVFNCRSIRLHRRATAYRTLRRDTSDSHGPS
jgi:hypothetical protein